MSTLICPGLESVWSKSKSKPAEVKVTFLGMSIVAELFTCPPESSIVFDARPPLKEVIELDV